MDRGNIGLDLLAAILKAQAITTPDTRQHRLEKAERLMPNYDEAVRFEIMN